MKNQKIQQMVKAIKQFAYINNLSEYKIEALTCERTWFDGWGADGNYAHDCVVVNLGRSAQRFTMKGKPYTPRFPEEYRDGWFFSDLPGREEVGEITFTYNASRIFLRILS